MNNPTITINGKVYEITFGPFGERLIDGKSQREFMNDLPDEDIATLATKGSEIIRDDLEYAQDIIQRGEITELEDAADAMI